MLTEKLLNAARTGEVLRVRYFGGSMPGAERRLRPIAIADGKVRALCMQSGETKSFVIEKMEEVVDSVPFVKVSPATATTDIFQSVEEFVVHYRLTFEAQGWVVLNEGQSVSLHRAFKNGKLTQTPDVALAFEAETYDAVFDGEQVVEANRRERARPWIVRGKNKTTKTFTDFAKCQLHILTLAKELGPNSAQ